MQRRGSTSAGFYYWLLKYKSDLFEKVSSCFTSHFSGGSIMMITDSRVVLLPAFFPKGPSKSSFFGYVSTIVLISSCRIAASYENDGTGDTSVLRILDRHRAGSRYFGSDFFSAGTAVSSRVRCFSAS